MASKATSKSPLRVGNKVLIRTVTHYEVGQIAEVSPTGIVLTGASWVADTGSLSQALQTGALNEVEVYPDGIAYVAQGAIVDVLNWAHALPTETK
jgi:hypothetical protein